MSDFDKNADEYAEQIIEGINLEKTIIQNKKFEECTFKNCNFNESAFIDCVFRDCNIKDSNLSLLKVKGSSFSRVSFYNSKMLGINWTEADWPKLLLGSPINFEECTISHSTFMGIALEEIKIIKCIAKDVDFREANLKNADFSYTDVAESLFMASNLSLADFSYAYNYQIDVTSNKVYKTRFSLPEAVSLLRYLEIDLVE